MAKEIGEWAISTEEGGSSQITRPATGGIVRQPDSSKFAPGNKSGGRKTKALEHAYLDAMRNALPPERIEELLEQALDLAQSSRSWRGIVEVIQLAMAYGAGKPVSKTVHTDGNLDALLAALQDDKPLLPASVTVQAVAGVSARLDVAAAPSDDNVIDGSIKTE